jgi:hypothetical protein
MRQSLNIEGLGVYCNLTILGLFLPLFLEILISLLIFYEPVVTYTISVLDGTQALISWELAIGVFSLCKH